MLLRGYFRGLEQSNFKNKIPCAMALLTPLRDKFHERLHHVIGIIFSNMRAFLS